MSHATNQVDARFGGVPGQPPPEVTLSQADELLSSVLPVWETTREAAANLIANDPGLYARAQQATSTNDVNGLAGVFAEASALASKAQAADLAHREAALIDRTKSAAQTAVGAGPGRIQAGGGGNEEWQQIAAAGKASPWTS